MIGNLKYFDRISLFRWTDNASSTMTTPKESSRKLVFHDSGETPPDRYSFASWEEHEHKKRRPNADNDDQDPPAAAI